MVQIAPSMLSANFARLEEDCAMLNRSQADLLHLDLMDGVFVDNISYGFPVVEAIAAHSTKPLDAHLMIVEPRKWFARLQKAGVQMVSVHWEACPHLHRALQEIRALGMKAGVALNPHNPVSLLEDLVEETDFVLLMSVNPGFGGQSFIPRTLEKVAQLHALRRARGLSFQIEVDGGVGPANAGALARAGADILVAGSSVFRAPDPLEAIRALKAQ